MSEDQTWLTDQRSDGLHVAARVTEHEGRFVVAELRITRPGGHLTGADARSIQIDRYKAQAAARARQSPNVRPPLTRPDGTNPDAFAQRVADAYIEAVLVTHAPAPRLAKEAGVPITTVHRWIREARQRGKLPPGLKGQRG